ncbi:hypothetical protein [Streptomyces roseolus]|uniref:hypothetical protein n=1 Tax=Streptomyces roseolus TaxID=67358 RepID=UPI00364A5759
MFLWEWGVTSLLFIGSGTERTWQDEAVLNSESDLPRILAPFVKLVEAAADGGRRTRQEAGSQADGAGDAG